MIIPRMPIRGFYSIHYATCPEDYVGIYRTKKEGQKEVRAERRRFKKAGHPPSMLPILVFVQPMGCVHGC